MAEHVAEIMNREVLAFEAQTPAGVALELLVQMGVTAAPIVDEADHPIGVVSLRGLIGAKSGERVAARMQSPALVVSETATIKQAAALIDELDVHHLVAIDEDGAIAGFVSSLDLVRGLTGAPARHPASFPHRDLVGGAAFTDLRRLDPEHVGVAPHSPGIVVLVRGGAGRPERIAGVETAMDLKEWVTAYFSDPAAVARRAGHPLGGPALRIRYAIVEDGARREAMAFDLREHAQHAMNVDARR